MALKRSNTMMATFSMASMTDVIFLLLIFFMVTSTFVFPTALDVNLPQSTRQTAVKPAVRLYIDNTLTLYVATGDDNPTPLDRDALTTWLKTRAADAPADTQLSVALYADETVPYGNIVDILNAGAETGTHIVLATKPVPTSSVSKYLR
ncbi:MAG: biopolymer transporter ExbD [Muribaculaceae bacterium]|nr:biopolymer transporter ExbD [Muribaculaceae bacterium]